MSTTLGGPGDPRPARESWRPWDQHAAIHARGEEAYQRDRAEHAALHQQEETRLLERLAQHTKAQEAQAAADTVRLEDHRLAHMREHEQTQRALDKAAAAVDERFHGVNATRQTLTDQASTFARAETVDARYTALANQLDTMERNLNDKRDVQTAELGKRLAALEKYQNSSTGRGAGSAQAITWIFAALSAIGATVTIVILIATHI